MRARVAPGDPPAHPTPHRRRLESPRPRVLRADPRRPAKLTCRRDDLCHFERSSEPVWGRQPPAARPSAARLQERWHPLVSSSARPRVAPSRLPPAAPATTTPIPALRPAASRPSPYRPPAPPYSPPHQLSSVVPFSCHPEAPFLGTEGSRCFPVVVVYR